MNEVVSKEHRESAGKIRTLLAAYRKNEDLINIGAYVKGSDPIVDKAILLMSEINGFLCQDIDDKADFSLTIDKLNNLAKKI